MDDQSDNMGLMALRGIVLVAAGMLTEARSEIRTIDYKSSTDMVTDLDRRVEAYLVDQIARSYPDDRVVAEEGTDRPGVSGFQWLIDPLDGTTNYVHGHPFYAVSVARLDASGPVMSAVAAPALDELWTAVRGSGARLERPLRGESRELPQLAPVPLTSALLGTGYPYERGEVCARNCDAVKLMLLDNCHGVRRGGSAALDLCHVGGGRLDGYWEHSLQPWDVAGGALVAAEAGALVTDMSGADAWLDGRHILAAEQSLHGVLKTRLGQVFEGLL